MTKPTYFATPAAFRSWLETNHAAKTELIRCCAAGTRIAPLTSPKAAKPKAKTRRA